MTNVVMDSSAVLALLYDEPGKDIVAAHSKGGQLLSVNLSEILTRVIDKNGDPVGVRKLIARLEIEIVDFDEELAAETARLRQDTQIIGASLGDRACLALAKSRRRAVLTADKLWDKLDVAIDIRQIR